jgi:hypothetical protein
MHHSEGLSGRLNPPTRFIYCLYSVFFSFLTPYIWLPGTFLLCVVLKPVKPIIFLSRASSSSSSIAIASPLGTGLLSFFFSGSGLTFGLESSGSGLIISRSPRSLSRIRSWSDLDGRAGDLVRVVALLPFFRGERDRERRWGLTWGGG